jgi:hypothetical protein
LKKLRGENMKETSAYGSRLKALREEQARLERKQAELLDKRRAEIGKLVERLGLLEADDDALAGAIPGAKSSSAASSSRPASPMKNPPSSSACSLPPSVCSLASMPMTRDAAGKIWGIRLSAKGISHARCRLSIAPAGVPLCARLRLLQERAVRPLPAAGLCHRADGGH